MDSTPLTCLSLCSGAGGIELGVSLAIPGLRTVGYVERNAYAAAVLLARMEDQTLEPAPIWCGELADLDARCFAGVDLVTAGFPCQPFSCAGKRNGTEDHRWLWPDISNLLRTVGPRYLFLENVLGILQRGLPFVLGDLAELGFDAEWSVFSAAASGAPHLRKRVFILARNANYTGQSIVSINDRKAPRVQEAAAHTDSKGLERRRLSFRVSKKHPRTSGGGWWEAEPKVGRVAHGVAARVDRLRVIGNGVVPAVAARAWTTLAGRIAGRDEKQ